MKSKCEKDVVDQSRQVTVVRKGISFVDHDSFLLDWLLNRTYFAYFLFIMLFM